MISASIDSFLARHSSKKFKDKPDSRLITRSVETPAGSLRVYDSGSEKPCVVLVPDGPNVIEHYEYLIELLTPSLRVVCFDMPGFGYSFPHPIYEHSLDQGARAVLYVMDALNIDTATLAFTCANGLYALRVAQLAPKRVSSLVLSQTPSLDAMHAWTKIVPRPVHVPVIGQIFAWLVRKKFADVWYLKALPQTTDAKPFQVKSLDALNGGSCFCLAGVVQGLCREQQNSLTMITTPCTMIWGEKDHSHKHTDPNSLLSLVPNATIVRFENCGHFPDLEHPDRFSEILKRSVMRYTDIRQLE